MHASNGSGRNKEAVVYRGHCCAAGLVGRIKVTVLRQMIGPIVLVFHLAVLLGAFIVFDQLVRLEYSQYRKAWDADGRPHRFFWVPSECTSAGGWLVSLRSSNAFRRNMFGWLFVTPSWMLTDTRALKRVYLLRALVFIWNFGLALTIAVILFVQQ
jgi:hypothetical protein